MIFRISTGTGGVSDLADRSRRQCQYTKQRSRRCVSNRLATVLWRLCPTLTHSDSHFRDILSGRFKERLPVPVICVLNHLSPNLAVTDMLHDMPSPPHSAKEENMIFTNKISNEYPANTPTSAPPFPPESCFNHVSRAQPVLFDTVSNPSLLPPLAVHPRLTVVAPSVIHGGILLWCAPTLFEWDTLSVVVTPVTIVSGACDKHRQHFALPKQKITPVAPPPPSLCVHTLIISPPTTKKRKKVIQTTWAPRPHAQSMSPPAPKRASGSCTGTCWLD